MNLHIKILLLVIHHLHWTFYISYTYCGVVPNRKWILGVITYLSSVRTNLKRRKMQKSTTEQPTTSFRCSVHKLLLTAEEPETTIRFNKTFVPLYKAYTKANISQAKAARQLQIKCGYGNQQKILKTFIVNIGQNTFTPTKNLIIEPYKLYKLFPYSDGISATKRTSDRRKSLRTLKQYFI